LTFEVQLTNVEAGWEIAHAFGSNTQPGTSHFKLFLVTADAVEKRTFFLPKLFAA
jgi:hypothetical protein